MKIEKKEIATRVWVMCDVCVAADDDDADVDLAHVRDRNVHAAAARSSCW